MIGAVDVAPSVWACWLEQHFIKKQVGPVEIADAAAYPDKDRQSALKCWMHSYLPVAMYLLRPHLAPQMVRTITRPNLSFAKWLKAADYFSASQLSWIAPVTSSADAPPT